MSTPDELNRIMDSGEAIAAMRAAIDDTPFRDDDLLDTEASEEWRGNLTGHQMRRWVRKNWHGGERGFIADNELGGDVADAKNAKAAQRGQDAARKRRPRNTNPYPDNDKGHELWDAAYRVALEESGP
jgi:hypothetical protein